jgi:hypothetical protein
LLNLIESIREQLSSGELVIPGDQWPVFLYANYTFDVEDPWKGVFRSSILVFISYLWLSFDFAPDNFSCLSGLQVCLYITEFS